MNKKKCYKCKKQINGDGTKSIMNSKKIICRECRIKEAIDLLQKKKR